jgi:hypothetical protein
VNNDLVTKARAIKPQGDPDPFEEATSDGQRPTEHQKQAEIEFRMCDLPRSLQLTRELNDFTETTRQIEDKRVLHVLCDCAKRQNGVTEGAELKHAQATHKHKHTRKLR